MSTLKIRKKSRFNSESGGAGWDKAWLYGVKPRKVQNKGRKRRRVRAERNAMRAIEAHRQAQDSNVSWDEVRVLLDEGMTLEEAKELCRSDDYSGRPGKPM